MSYILALVYLLIILVVCVEAANRTMRHPATIIYAFTVYVGFSVYEWLSGTSFIWSIIVYNVGITDVLCLYLAFVTFLTYRKNHRLRDMGEHVPTYPKYIQIALFLVVAVMMVSFFRGVLNYGYGSDVQIDVRRFLEQWAIPLACVMYFHVDEKDPEVRLALKRMTTLIILFCVICWILILGLGIQIAAVGSDAESPMRVMRPEQSCMIGMLGIYYLDRDLREKNKISPRAIMLFLVVILLQHRSAWAALAVGLGLFVLMNLVRTFIANGGRVTRAVFLQTVGLIIGIFVAIGMLSGTTLFSQLLAGLEGFKGEEGTTLEYRFQLWAATLATLSSAFEWIFGKPFGSGYIVELAEYSREITPHNAYIHGIIRIGIVGVAFCVYQLLTLVVCGVKKKNRWMIIIPFMVLAFWGAYTYSVFCSFMIGFVASTMREKDDYELEGEADSDESMG